MREYGMDYDPKFAGSRHPQFERPLTYRAIPVETLAQARRSTLYTAQRLAIIDYQPDLPGDGPNGRDGARVSYSI